ncbi:MAG TPA: hypothetical protein VFW98_11845 [Gemmatimonadaceae bacterium]|nr:hypothetical protein [Gemmatimonadaceae bacterium]
MALHERERFWRRLRPVLLPAAVLLCGAGSVHMRAPRIRVAGVQDLTFGKIVPGVTTTILLTDAGAGQYTLTNQSARTVQVQLVFVLPTALALGGGTTIPISFGPASAGFSPSGSLADVVPFDPAVPFTVTIDSKRTARVFLGGTLQPVAGQPAGSYTVPITLTTN